VSSARWDLCGGRPAMTVPTANRLCREVIKDLIPIVVAAEFIASL
jgi:hypothetical protein